MAEDKKITEITEQTTAPTPDDLVVLVDDPGGTAATKKMTHVNFMKFSCGADGITNATYHGWTMAGRVYGETVAFGQAVTLKNDGKVYKADADDSALWPARGLAVVAGNENDAALVLTLGFVRYDTWTWVTADKTPAQLTLYLNDTAGGVVQETAPSGSGDCIQVIGFALSDDEAFFNFTGVYIELT